MDLHTACALGDYDCVRARLAEGADPNRGNAEGWTPLLYAAFLGHDTIVNQLLDTGDCLVDACGRDGRTPLAGACAAGHESVVYFLLQHNASLEAVDVDGCTPLVSAAIRNHLVGARRARAAPAHTPGHATRQSVVKVLLEHGARTEARDPATGWTPLLVAAAHGFDALFQCLLTHVRRVWSEGKGAGAAAAAATADHPWLLLAPARRAPM